MSQRASHPALALLTRNPLKAQLYSQEPYFRQAFGDLESLLGPGTVETVLQHGLVVVKPDGFALGVCSTVVDFCDRHGFEPLDARPVAFAPAVWKSLWTYQMTQASIDRLLVNDLLLSGDAVALLLRSRAGPELPATVRLSALKGPARMDRQDDDCLRRAIRQPNLIFSLVHSADEPADLVRELGILFGMGDRRAMASAMAAGERPPDSCALLEVIRRSDARPRRTFDRDASRKRVIGAVTGRLQGDGPMPAAHRETLLRGIIALDAGQPVPLPAFLGALLDLKVPADPWDLAVTFSDIIEPDERGSSKILENLGISPWERR